eukprot:TRINITY_DN61834_c0_g1_i1.p1 TRINITY_DN61834_c0_g1~~TRINITY_DN61834_c0_g1_i1.p1  ORF type:complete len:391 (-),score=43.28 TRINITY_DN61834_c0_g1_i1:210-1382(-)
MRPSACADRSSVPAAAKIEQQLLASFSNQAQLAVLGFCGGGLRPELEFFSVTHDVWVPCRIIDVHRSSGSVMLDVKPGSWISAEAQSTRLRSRRGSVAVVGRPVEEGAEIKPEKRTEASGHVFDACATTSLPATSMTRGMTPRVRAALVSTWGPVPPSCPRRSRGDDCGHSDDDNVGRPQGFPGPFSPIEDSPSPSFDAVPDADVVNACASSPAQCLEDPPPPPPCERKPLRRRLTRKTRDVAWTAATVAASSGLAQAAKPSVASSPSGSLLAALGHSLRPPQMGQSVVVIGDGWGQGTSGYEAVITEADFHTFTVVSVSGESPWTETHALRRYCIVLENRPLTRGTTANLEVPFETTESERRERRRPRSSRPSSSAAAQVRRRLRGLDG